MARSGSCPPCWCTWPANRRPDAGRCTRRCRHSPSPLHLDSRPGQAPQRKPPGVLMQATSGSQPPLLVAHSSTSVHGVASIAGIPRRARDCTGSRPAVFEQVVRGVLLHASVPRAHSSMSEAAGLAVAGVPGGQRTTNESARHVRARHQRVARRGTPAWALVDVGTGVAVARVPGRARATGEAARQVRGPWLLELHPPLLVAHSFTSVQVCPSPVYPGGQEPHWYPPAVLLHATRGEQVSSPCAHSSTSVQLWPSPTYPPGRRRSGTTPACWCNQRADCRRDSSPRIRRCRRIRSVRPCSRPDRRRTGRRRAGSCRWPADRSRRGPRRRRTR